MYDIKEWKHIFKLDPNKEISDADLERVCESGTDAVMIGGSDGITEDNVLNMLVRVRRYSVPCVLEVSTVDSITPGYDFYFVPTVLNSSDRKWILDLHHQALLEFGDIMNWDEIFAEGYCVLNADSKVADLTHAKTDLSDEEVIAYARMADKLLHLPIFYLEYSGVYGDPNLVQKVSDVLETSRLFYGGGIETIEQAKEMGAAADTVIVGNLLYSDIGQALKTVAAVKENS
ncbi:putative glycerol-1-phosphate prenyltransferase [Bacillus mesophilus]|uniref:Heptaprenylglyceryl phosphate synthase n=1 Tax=Bacillus mesophilus TaxID=1808955 RepID=A0A6M0QCB8_9BACI|nr:heptaprenylglyceryl phosphate synthase [Bacillus mesophilus]MBM7662760.1 putative glycerol-1-phosphate prenyltransferase [Bacillus mesophilus]NEY73180.1 heptaprenylglyceryl phosphate synthase [Bacillus mesophilus]